MLTPDRAAERHKLTKGPSSEDEAARLAIEVDTLALVMRVHDAFIVINRRVLYCVCASKLTHCLLE